MKLSNGIASDYILTIFKNIRQNKVRSLLMLGEMRAVHNHNDPKDVQI